MNKNNTLLYFMWNQFSFVHFIGIEPFSVAIVLMENVASGDGHRTCTIPARWKRNELFSHTKYTFSDGGQWKSALILVL